MDDILTENHKDLTSSRLSDANSLHSNLRFTLERETNGVFSYLDMKVINNNGALESIWYIKPTDNGLGVPGILLRIFYEEPTKASLYSRKHKNKNTL